MASSYRQALGRCELCASESAMDDLQDFAGLRCCPRCVRGDLKAALSHWGFTLDERFTPSGRRSSQRFFIEVQRPTFFEAFAKFEADSGEKGWFSRLFKKSDPEVGDQTFDNEVWVAPDPGSDDGTMSLLQHAGVRVCVLELIRLGAMVDLTGNSVWVHDSDTGLLDDFAEMHEVIPYAVALAVHVERAARQGIR